MRYQIKWNALYVIAKEELKCQKVKVRTCWLFASLVSKGFEIHSFSSLDDHKFFIMLISSLQKPAKMIETSERNGRLLDSQLQIQQRHQQQWLPSGQINQAVLVGPWQAVGLEEHVLVLEQG